GKSNLEYNLEEIDIELTKAQKKHVLGRIIELGDKKETITVGDLPYIISDVLETPQEKTFKLELCNIVTSMELKPIAVVKLLYKDKRKDKEIRICNQLTRHLTN
ncbi:unnamed protein product, partial [marine sediment metagenome]